MKSSPSAVHSFVLRYFLRINHLSTLPRLRSLKKKELKQRKEKKKRKKMKAQRDLIECHQAFSDFLV